MSDDINQKVINIFQRHKKHLPNCNEEKVVMAEDGYYYVCFSKDDNGFCFNENHLIERAKKCQYIVRVMIPKNPSPYIYNYKVHGDELLDFLKGFITGEKEGKVIEIDKYIPEDLA
jgi:hypothetical protein